MIEADRLKLYHFGCLIDHCWRCWFFEDLLLGVSAVVFLWGFWVFLFSLFGVILGF